MAAVFHSLRTHMVRLVLISVLLLTGMYVSASIIGIWNGKLSVRGMELPVVLHFEAAGDSMPVCTMDSPAQGAKDIPAEVEYLTADSVRISISKLYITYEARYDADSIYGIFRQGFTKLPLTMVRGEFELRRPQEPKPPFPYSVEEVSFCNAADSAILAGSLVIPDEDIALPDMPVVIMVTGSGQQNRDEELLGHKPFLVIADYLARRGIASLRYDDRGHAASSGDLSQATTVTFRDDARAGTDLLRRDGRFGKVGVLGHSEGGQIAYMLASEGAVDFAVSLAGPAMRGDSVLIYQNFELLRPSVGDSVAEAYCLGLADALRCAVTYDGPVAQATASGIMDRILTEKAISLPSHLRANLVEVIVSTSTNPWLRHFVSYDPADDIRAITVPVMAVVGSLDRQVTSGPTVAALNDLLKSDGSIIREYTGLNHMFQHATTGMTDEYSAIEETVSEEVLADIAAFIRQISRSSLSREE